MVKRLQQTSTDGSTSSSQGIDRSRAACSDVYVAYQDQLRASIAYIVRTRYKTHGVHDNGLDELEVGGVVRRWSARSLALAVADPIDSGRRRHRTGGSNVGWSSVDERQSSDLYTLHEED